MNKQEFLAQLQKGLAGLPQEEVEERLAFYSEVIDDRTEEGISQEEAVAQVGPVSEVLSQIIADIPLSKIAKEKIKPKRRLKAWEIILLAIGSPIWLPLLCAAVVVTASLYAAWWSVIGSLWAVFGALAACAVSGIASGIGLACCESTLSGIAVVGAGMICAGLAIFFFFGCEAATKGTVLLTKKFIFSIKKWFIDKEETQ